MPVAALYTRNKVKAAHILYNTEKAAGKVRALLVNSGCANACTGAEGIEDLASIAGAPRGLLGIKQEEILFASTGVIGKRLPVETITAALPGLVAGLDEKNLDAFARAIMTTDTYPKTVEEALPGGKHRVAGVAKGAGMMNPLFATMLAFVFTDYPLDACSSSACSRSRQAELRAHQRRRRHEHERYGPALLDGGGRCGQSRRRRPRHRRQRPPSAAS